MSVSQNNDELMKLFPEVERHSLIVTNMCITVGPMTTGKFFYYIPSLFWEIFGLSVIIYISSVKQVDEHS